MKKKTTKGKLVVISAPSGGGKTTVIKKLIERIPGSGKLISSTSRPIREGETDGVDYHFLTRVGFEKKIAAGEFVEHAIYAGEHYGMEQHALDTALNSFEIAFNALDVQGKQKYDEIGLEHTSIFLIPEDMSMLTRNIEKRGLMDPKALKKRLAVAEHEIEQAKEYDYQITNKEGKLDEVVDEIITILENVN